MQAKNPFAWLRAVSVIFAIALFLTSARAADHQTVLYTFGNPPDGTSPAGNLIMDAAGNLYGTTYQGGIYCRVGCGTVFELSPTTAGKWTETVLHNFGNGNDGATPNGSLIIDAAGNFYGTTNAGGISGVGTAFELSPSQGGSWTETVLHNFGNGNDGAYPDGGVIRDAAGNLYGVTMQGGIYAEGTVFELSPSEGGGWTETVLHNFGNGNDAAYPGASLIMDAAGNVYGTTEEGGQGGGFCQSYGCGTVFELSPSDGGGWAETVLYSFNGSDGSQPDASLVMDAAGNLYGTTIQGGPYCAPFGCGTVFELSPSAGGGWTETTLYNFKEQPDGALPESSLILDAAGNLYGTTTQGGSADYGTAFEISPRQSGWTETVLFSFDQLTSGADPTSGLIMDRFGDLYGATELGGTYYGGLAYKLTPHSICAAHCVSTER